MPAGLFLRKVGKADVRRGRLCLAALGLAALTLQPAQAQSRMTLGRLTTGATVVFVKENGGWGMEIGGAKGPRLLQHQPARLDIFADGKPQTVAAGYGSVSRSQDGITATAEVPFGPQVTFHIEDRWRLKADPLWVHRHVAVSGDAAGRLWLGSDLFHGAGCELVRPEIPRAQQALR